MTLPEGDWSPIEADASTRTYFKGYYRGMEALLADFGNDNDGRNRFLHVTRLFESHGLRVPRIYFVPDTASYLVIEWIRGSRLSALKWSKDFEAELLITAAKVAKIEDWGNGPALLSLDRARLSFELIFFNLHFVGGFLNAKTPAALLKGFEALAEAVGTFPYALAHRDLHSDNVMVEENGAMVLIDFQDALMAPRCYDAASLAVDAYREQDPAIRERFMAGWCHSSGATAREFRMTALQRALKALGTFGYQATRRKKARYLAFIPPTAAHALALLNTAPEPLEGLRSLLEGALHAAGPTRPG